MAMKDSLLTDLSVKSGWAWDLPTILSSLYALAYLILSADATGFLFDPQTAIRLRPPLYGLVVCAVINGIACSIDVLDVSFPFINAISSIALLPLLLVFHQIANDCGISKGVFRLRPNVVMIVCSLLGFGVVVEWFMRARASDSTDLTRINVSLLIRAVVNHVLCALAIMLLIMTPYPAFHLLFAASAHTIILIFSHRFSERRYEGITLIIMFCLYFSLTRTTVSISLHS
uniref:Uncharacterized protein n=1 Tax=Spongospora subterranea TaxID=70186 RepID=A0A0H5QZ64_9EUKA|eukprot:CRZ00839.1 hypothetical protein [Spongospora subterranea]